MAAWSTWKIGHHCVCSANVPPLQLTSTLTDKHRVTVGAHAKSDDSRVDRGLESVHVLRLGRQVDSILPLVVMNFGEPPPVNVAVFGKCAAASSKGTPANEQRRLKS